MKTTTRTIAPGWVWDGHQLRTNVAIAIDATGTIVDLGPAERYPDAERLPGRLVLPGLANAHSHAFQRAIRGHVQWRPAGQDDFWSWRDRMYAAANELSPEGIEAVSALAFLEMAEAGVTTVGEFHYVQHQPGGTPYADKDELARRVIAAARRVGIRICLLRVAYARAGAGLPLRADQSRFGDRTPDDVLAALSRLSAQGDPGVRIGLAPHSVRALDRDWLAALSAWPGLVHAHVSEQPAENEACLAEHGLSPLATLHRAGLVRPGFTAVHLTHPLPGDVALLAAAGGTVCVCPSTELDLGDGFLPVEAREQLPMCVGSDSQARIDLLAEARDLELHARGVARRRNVLAPEGDRHGLAARLLRAATLDGDRALGGAGAGLRIGAPADLVALDLARPGAEGVPPLEAAAFVATPEWVDRVWVAGVEVVRGGRHVARERIAAAARPFLATP